MTVTTEGGQHKDTCEVDITFTTTDLTVVHPEKVQLDKAELVFEIELIKEGRRNSPTLTWKITPPQQLSAVVLPEAAHNKNYTWSVSDQDMVSVDHGLVTARQEAQWIQDLNGKEGSKEAVVMATAEDGGIQEAVKSYFIIKQQTAPIPAPVPVLPTEAVEEALPVLADQRQPRRQGLREPGFRTAQAGGSSTRTAVIRRISGCSLATMGIWNGTILTGPVICRPDGLQT